MKTYDLLRRGAAEAWDEIAISCDKRRISFGELLMATEKVGRALESARVPGGSRAAILYENSIEYVIFFFSALRAGLVVVPLDTSLAPDKLGLIIHDCQARILFIQSTFTRFLPQMALGDSSLTLLVSEQPVECESSTVIQKDLRTILERPDTGSFRDLLSDIDCVAPRGLMRHDRLPDISNDLAAIFYTSGSTGKPKGVMLSHRNLISNTVGTVEYLRLTKADSVIVVLPFYYIYGNSLILTHALAGGRLVIDNRFMYPQAILGTMIEQKVTGFSGVPSNFTILLNNPNFSASALPDLRYVTQAGGAMAPETIRRVIAALPGKEIYIMYGQTEAGPRVSYVPPDRLCEKVGSIGIPIPGITVTICDDEGREVPAGAVGEITVSGGSVMLGYWGNPGEQKTVLRKGRLFTGDLAYRDNDNYLFIVGRKKEIIKVGGNRVSAKEIEETLLEHPKISEAAAFGVSDEILGEVVKAIVVLRPGQAAEAKEIQAYCRAKMPMHKVPRHIAIRSEIPKYGSGKINKEALRAN